MRHKWLWTISILVGLVVVAAFLAGPHPPFNFLAGHHPVRNSGEVDQHNMTTAVYSCFTDFSTLSREAKRELDEHGFKLTPTSSREGQALYLHPSLPNASVMILKETRMRINSDPAAWPLVRTSEKGWVTVVIHQSPDESFLDRFRNWLGLWP